MRWVPNGELADVPDDMAGDDLSGAHVEPVLGAVGEAEPDDVGASGKRDLGTTQVIGVECPLAAGRCASERDQLVAGWRGRAGTGELFELESDAAVACRELERRPARGRRCARR